MPTRVRCPNPECGKSYTVSDESRGREAVCKRCGRRFVLSAQGEETHHSAARSDTLGGKPGSALEGMPSKLGRFQIRSRLGAGSFGAVYRAHDPTLGREVALKVPHRGTLQTKGDRARFLREPKAAAQLRHPNIVPIYEAGVDGEMYYIASAFIEGQTLEDAIEKSRLSLERAARIVMDLAGALDYAHSKKVIHRDVKPANIMLDASGDPLLMDFGLARLAETESKLTMDGALLGTPAYMSPEQAAREHSKVGPASDQYSLGVVLYEFLSGEVPFSGPPAMVISLVANQDPPSPRNINPEIPKDLETICLKAMSKDRGQRYANCLEMADDLRRWQQGEPIHARQVGAMERLWRWCRRNPAVAGLSTATVLLLFVVAVVLSVAYLRTSHALDREAAARSDAEIQRDRAEQEQQRARTAEQKAIAAEQKAKKEAEEADRARNDAQKALADLQTAQRQTQDALTKAEEAAEKEAAERKRAEASAYSTKLAMAQKAWIEGDFTAGKKHLEDCPLKFRDWEWNYLNRLHHPAVLTIGQDDREMLHDLGAGHPFGEIMSSNPVLATFSPDGKSIVLPLRGTVHIWDATTGDKRKTLPLGKSGRPTSGNRTAPSGKITDPFLPPSGKGNDPFGAPSGKRGDPFRAPSGNRNDPFANSTGSPSARETAWAFDASGKLVGAGTDRGAIMVWHAATGKEALTISANNDASNAITGLAFGPTGRRIASASSDGTVRIWDLSDGRELRRLQDPAGKGSGVISVSIDCNGRRIASGSDHSVIVWNANTGKVEHRLSGHQDRVTQVTFSSDGNRIASASEDKTVRIWDVARGQVLVSFTGHTGKVAGVAFSPDGEWIASASEDKTVKVWDTATGHKVQHLPGHQKMVSSVAFSPDGKHVVSASGDGSIKLWEVMITRYGEIATRTRRARKCAEATSPDGKRIAVGYGDGTLTVCDAASKEELLTLRAHAEGITKVEFSPDGARILCTGKEGTTTAIDSVGSVRGRQVRTLDGHEGQVSEVAFSPDSDRIASASWDETVRVWDTVTGQERLCFSGHEDSVTAVAFGPDGRQIASVGNGGTVRVWDAATGNETLTFGDLPRGVGHDKLSFSPDGARLFVFRGEKTEVRDVATGQMIVTYRAGGCAAFSSDGTQILSTDALLINTVMVREVATGRQLLACPGHGKAVTSVAFSHDGTRIISLSSDALKLWDVEAGNELLTLKSSGSRSYGGGVSRGRAVAISPNGQQFAVLAASAGFGLAGANSVKLCDAATGRFVSTLRTDDELTSVVFSPDGKWIASGGRDGTVSVWNASGMGE